MLLDDAKPAVSSNTTLGAALWIGVAAILPVYRLVMTDVSALYPYAILVLLLACTALGRLLLPIYPRLWLLALLVIPMAAVVSGTSTSVIASSYVGVKLALFVGLTPFVLRYYVAKDPNFARRALTAFIAVQTLSAGAGLVQVTGIRILGRAANSGRANGLAVHPNVLGVMCAIAILICIAVIPKTSGRARLGILVVAAVNTAALFATGSLSSLLAVAVGIAVLLICMRATLRALALGAAASTVAFLGLTLLGYNTTLLTGNVGERIDVVTGVSDGVASLSVRQKTYDFAWQSISGDPLTGVGMDSTNEGTFDYKTVVHNYLLHAWYQGGVLLFAVFLAVTLAMIVLIFKSMRDADNGVAAATIAAILTFAATSAFYDQQQYWLPVLAAVAAIAPKASKPIAAKPEASEPLASKPPASKPDARKQHPLPTLHPASEESNA